MTPRPNQATRRDWLKTAGSGILYAPAVIAAERERPQVTGVQIGDVTPGKALVWVRGDRPARLMVEVATNERFTGARRFTGPEVSAATDFTGRYDLPSLPPGVELHYRAWLQASGVQSEPVRGRFRTAPITARDVKFVWSGDTVGQGYGINPDWGGMRCYETMRSAQPDFFLHSGDTIYADGPLQAEYKLPDGTLWRNLVTEEKSKPAETLAEFRGNYRYNLLDQNVRRFLSEVPQLWQWDDHEVCNNWSPGKELPATYRERNIRTLVDRARQAFLEYAPIRLNGDERQRIYRRISYGPLLDVFVIDMRSYRAANNANRQEVEGPETTYLGLPQRRWLEADLRASRAAWKVIASDMPIGFIVSDGQDQQGQLRYENSANGDGPPLGRELEIAALLRSLKTNGIRNVVWLTADVHYTAALFYDPTKARFTEFDPFWEFVSGPVNAGTFGPGPADPTFGPQVVFQKAPPKGQSNLPPSAGLQFFGEVAIDGRTREMRVTLRDVAGANLFTKTLAPTGV